MGAEGAAENLAYNIQPTLNFHQMPLHYNVDVGQSPNTQLQPSFVPIKPMYATRNSQVSAGGKGNRRQVIQQIIHNNGSGNILFSSGGISSAVPQGRKAATGRVTSGVLTNQPMLEQYQTTPTRNAAMTKAYQAHPFKQ